LWRTCRVLANRSRLKMFHLLLKAPELTVTDVARELRQSLPLTSEYLRALEARGLLTVHRRGRWVTYRPNGDSSLVTALFTTLHSSNRPLDTIYRLATAFTHPRRVAIYSAVAEGPRTAADLHAGLRLSARALQRHLRKLTARGFVVERDGTFAVRRRHDGLGRELARLAVVQRP